MTKVYEQVQGTRPLYVHRHVISFEETNLVGNVYYVRHIAWQGRCREFFLRDYAPEILDELARDLRLVTLRVSCEYFQELRAFEEIWIQMALAHQHGHRIGLDFNYTVVRHELEVLVARGFQEIGCMRLSTNGLAPCSLPLSLSPVLAAFARAPDSD